MFGRRYITPMVFIFLCILANLAYAAKSVFVISSQDNSIVKPYRIDANHITLQATSALPQEGGGAVALAVWPQKELLFATYDFSSVIAWVSTRNLVNPGEYTEPNCNSYYGFGGIAVDTGKEKIYVAERQTQYLHVYKWNDSQKVLEPNGIKTLSGLEPPSYGAFGLALDANTGRLYVTDNTNTIRCYDTNTWQYDPNNSFTISHAAVGIAIDPCRGYLYTGDFPDGSGNTYLVRTLTTSPHTSIETDLNNGYSVIGIDVDRDTGLVYCTTANNDFRVYDCNLNLQDSCSNIGYSQTGPGPAGVAVGGYYFTQDFNITKTDNVSSCVSPNDTINYNICYDANGFADSNVVIVDQLPAEINFVSASGGVSSSYYPSSRTVTWNLGTLTSNATGCVQLTVTVNSQAQQVCYIANTCEMLGDTFSGCATEKTYICGKHPVVYVDVNKPAGGNGQSWVTAYKELRDALTNVRDGNCPCAEQIWVAKGTYKPANADATLQMVDNVDLYGSFDGNETSINQRNLTDVNKTILTGDIDDNNTSDVQYVVTAASARLDGFTIKKAKNKWQRYLCQ